MKPIINLDNDTHKDRSKRRLVLGEQLGLKDTINIENPYLVNLYDKLKSQDWTEDELNMEQDRIDLVNAPQTVKDLFKLNLTYQFEIDSLLSETYCTLLAPFVTDSQYADMLSIIQYNECLTPEHEVLTPQGWKSIASVVKDEEVLQFSMDGSLSFAKVLDTITKEYDDNLISLRNASGHVKQLVTKGHRVLINTLNGPNKGYSFKRADSVNLHGGNTLPLSGVKLGVKQKLTPFEKLLIAFQADGGYLSHKYNGKISGSIPLRFKFKKQRKISKFLELLAELPYEHVVKEYSNGYTVFVVKIPVESFSYDWKDFNSWVDLKGVSSSWCKEFIEYATHWDGCDRSNVKRKKKVIMTYISTDYPNIVTFQTIAHMANYRAKLYKSTPKDRKTCYQVTVTDTNYVCGNTIIKEDVPYRGSVHCITVPSGAFLVRYQDTISITGNCLHSRSYLFTIRKVFPDPNEIFDLIERIGEVQERSEVTFKCLSDLKEAGAKYVLGMVENNQELFNIVFKGIFSFYILEKFNFMSSFATTFIIPEAFNGLMMNSSKQVQKIAQDELIHWQAGEYVIKKLISDDPRGKIAFEQCREELIQILEESLQAEYRWSDFILSEGREVVGLNSKLLKDYVLWNMNETKRILGLYNGPKEEMPLKFMQQWLDLDSVQHAMQESSSNNYLLNTVVNDLDDDLNLDW